MKIEQSVLDQIRSRPRFTMITNKSRDEYTLFLKKFVDEKSSEYAGNVNSEAAIISCKTEHNNYWKPTLSLRTEHDGELDQTKIRGIFGPSSAVWTFFMFLYFALGILWMVFITIWFVEKQIKSNDFPWAFSLSVVTLVLIVLLYLASLIGQRKAKDEMQKLRDFAEELLQRLER